MARTRRNPLLSPWKTPSDVRRIRFTKGTDSTLVQLGKGKMGKVYFGKLVFNDGKRHRVAIKQFDSPYSNREVFRRFFDLGVTRLRKAGVRIPKVGLVKIPTQRYPAGEYMMVSPLFGSTRSGSQLRGDIRKEDSIELRVTALAELTKIANAGFLPSADCIQVFKDLKRGVLSIDLDYIFWHILDQGVPFRRTTAQEAADVIVDMMNELSNNNDELPKLWKVINEHASPAVRKGLRRIHRFEV